MADIDISNPADNAIVSTFPSNERASRAALLALTAGGLRWGGTSGGSADAQTVTVSNTGLTLTNGLLVAFIAGFTTTDAATLTVNSLTATTMALPNGTAFSTSTPGAVTAGELYFAVYDGTYFRVLNASGYQDQTSYDLERPVGFTILMRETTDPNTTKPFGVTATWTRTTSESYLRIEGTTPTTGGSLTSSTHSGHTHGAGSYVASATGSSELESILDNFGSFARNSHIHDIAGTSSSGGSHSHTIEPTFRSYAVWERTA